MPYLFKKVKENMNIRGNVHIFLKRKTHFFEDKKYSIRRSNLDGIIQTIQNEAWEKNTKHSNRYVR